MLLNVEKYYYLIIIIIIILRNTIIFHLHVPFLHHQLTIFEMHFEEDYIHEQDEN